MYIRAASPDLTPYNNSPLWWAAMSRQNLQPSTTPLCHASCGRASPAQIHTYFFKPLAFLLQSCIVSCFCVAFDRARFALTSTTVCKPYFSQIIYIYIRYFTLPPFFFTLMCRKVAWTSPEGIGGSQVLGYRVEWFETETIRDEVQAVRMTWESGDEPLETFRYAKYRKPTS